MNISINKYRRPGATLAGIFGLAMSSVLLLCGAGLTPTGQVQKADINANGFSLTNAATVSAVNLVGDGLGVTNVTAGAVQWTNVTARPSLPLAVTNGGTGTNAPALIAGTNVTVTGTWPNQTINASSGAVEWELKTSAFTAAAGHKYQIDTSGGAVTVTLPATASVMDAIEFADAKLSWNANNVTLSRNGLNINNGTSNYTASVQGNKLSVVYISSGYGWSIK
jgi:hypothetical protein